MASEARRPMTAAGMTNTDDHRSSDSAPARRTASTSRSSCSTALRWRCACSSCCRCRGWSTTASPTRTARSRCRTSSRWSTIRRCSIRSSPRSFWPLSTSLICCAVAAPMGWLVARTDMPLRRTVRLLVTASFVTPPFLGAIAWELLAAPNSGPAQQALPHADRRRFRCRPVQHLFVPGTDLRHRLLHVSLCVRAGRQRARPHAGRA